MLEILQFYVSGFWTWLGITLVVVWVTCFIILLVLSIGGKK